MIRSTDSKLGTTLHHSNFHFESDRVKIVRVHHWFEKLSSPKQSTSKEFGVNYFLVTYFVFLFFERFFHQHTRPNFDVKTGLVET